MSTESLASDVVRRLRLRLFCEVARARARLVVDGPLDPGVPSTVSVISIGVDGSCLTLRPVMDSLSMDA